MIRLFIDGIDYTSELAIPVQEQYVLNSALDNGVITLPATKIKDVFKPNTKVTITKDNDTYTMNIASDKSVELVGGGLWQHTIVLIEETKDLEKKVVDTNTTTNPLVHDYFKNRSKVNYEILKQGFIDPTTPDSYVTPLATGEEFTFLKFSEVFSDLYQTGVLQLIVTKDGEEVYNELGSSAEYTTTLETGEYTVTYCYQGGDAIIFHAGKYKYTFAVMKRETATCPTKSITDVVNRLLIITDTLRKGDTPALTFNSEQATFYDQRDENGEPLYPAPEFSMTKSTLRECLDQVGGNIHAIVRLKGNEIYFDKLGGTTQETLPADYVGHYETLDGEQYASQLDTIVSNLMNIDDEAQGTMIEPYSNGLETVRAESGTIRIGDGTDNTSCIIETDYPIEKILRLECGYITVNGTEYYVGDITPYVFENTEYNLLSSTAGQFPYSKGYALSYTIGEKNITGLTFKLPNAVSSVLSNQAIINIISQKLGFSVQTLFTVQNFTELNFRIAYYPSTTARVKQVRTDALNYSSELTSIYNQTANKVDSRAYGENLKGAIARLGNIEKFITFQIKGANKLPEVGNYVIINNNDYYIATINIEAYTDHYKVTAGLSKDFNALSKYIGIKNNVRMYEISERQVVERYIPFCDYCIIGTQEAPDVKVFLAQRVTVNYFRDQFNGTTRDFTRAISFARLQGVDKDGNDLQKVDLPVVSLAVGNSVWLGCHYADNYSAGNKSVLPEQSTGYYRTQDYVQYTDTFGEIEYLHVNMYPYGEAPTNQARAVEIGNDLPEATQDLSDLTAWVSTTYSGTIMGHPLWVKKDNRETLNLNYQLHFITNDNTIIGSQLAQGNMLVTKFTKSSADLYILPTRLNKLESKIDLTNATLVLAYDGTGNTYISRTGVGRFKFKDQTATAGGQSWAMVDHDTGKLLFGKNIAVTNGQTIELPTFTFVNKIY